MKSGPGCRKAALLLSRTQALLHADFVFFSLWILNQRHAWQKCAFRITFIVLF